MTARARSSGSVATACLFGLGVVSGAARAGADPPVAQASLTYERQPGAETCPTETLLREQVTLRLGYDPFRDGAMHHVSVSIAPKAGGLHARIRTFDLRADAGATALRELDSEGDGCDELVQSVVLAVSLAIDPMSFARPRASPAARADAPPSAAGAPDARVGDVPAVPPPHASESSPWNVEVLAAARVGFGLVPGVSVGPIVDLRVGEKGWALLAEGGADLPTGTRFVSGSGGPGVLGSLIRGGVGACGLVDHFSLCGRLDLGALHGTGTGMLTATDATTLYADVAIAAGVAVPVANGWRAIAAAELLAPLTPTTLHVGAVEAWSSPTLAGSVALGVGHRF